MLSRKQLLGGTAALLSVLAVLQGASATTFEKMSMVELAQSADLVVIGEAISTESLRENGQVVTRTTFDVMASATGSGPKTVTVETPGGRFTRGKIIASEVVAGAPTFFTGSQAMLFLSEGEGGRFSIVGFNQGLFAVNDGSVAFAPADGGVMAMSKALSVVQGMRSSALNQLAE